MKLIRRTPWGYTIHDRNGQQTGCAVGLPATGWYTFITSLRTWRKRGLALVVPV